MRDWIIIDDAALGFLDAFNSLFEMLALNVAIIQNHIKHLSILYLRCKGPSRLDIDLSLVDLSILYLRC